MSPVISLSTAAVLHGPRDIRITERRIWQPSQDQVQVQVVSTGLCGSDRMYPSSSHIHTLISSLKSSLLHERS